MSRDEYRAYKDETLQRANEEHAIDRLIKRLGLAALCAMTVAAIYWIL
jgi:hypothetical protein